MSTPDKKAGVGKRKLSLFILNRVLGSRQKYYLGARYTSIQVLTLPVLHARGSRGTAALCG